MFKTLILYFSEKKIQVKKNMFWAMVVVLHVLYICGCSSKKKQDYESYNTNYVPEEDFVEDFYSNVTIDIINIQSNTSTGTVKVTIPDLKGIYLKHQEEFSENPTSEQIRDILTQNLDEFVIEQTFDSDLYKDGQEWRLVSTEQIDSYISEVVDNYLKAVLADTQISDIIIDVEEIERILE